MISQLKGQVVEITGGYVTLDVGGVGYELICSRSCIENMTPGEPTTVVVYTEVREDAIRLFGFRDRLERQVFLMLTRVKGVGAKTASEVISRVDRLKILKVIGAGDLGALQAIKGIGRKTAERIIVELRDKVGEYAVESSLSSLSVEREIVPVRDAIAALMALGFSSKDADRATAMVDLSKLSQIDSGQIVKEALRFI